MILGTRTWRRWVTPVLSVLMLCAACTGTRTGDEGSAGVPNEFAQIGAIEVTAATPIESGDGFLHQSDQGLVLFHKQDDSICRYVLETMAERCVADERLVEAGIDRRAASDWKLIANGNLGFGSARRILVNFESESVVELDDRSGSPVAISPDGSAVLQLDWTRTGQAFVSDLAGSSVVPLGFDGLTNSGVWPVIDEVWLAAESEVVAVGTGTDGADQRIRVDTSPLISSFFLQTYPELDLAVVWDNTQVANLEFAEATWLIDFEHRRPLQVPGLADAFLVGLGVVAGEGSEVTVMSIWDQTREDGEVDVSLFVTPVDRSTGDVGALTKVHSFDLSLALEEPAERMSAFPLEPYQIFTNLDGTLTWYTGSAIMEAQIVKP